MRITSYQRQGCAPEKTEMEDRIAIGKSVLATGFHCCSALDNGICAVCDGVGGLKGSAFASSLAARTIADLAVPTSAEAVTKALKEVHEDLVNYSSTATTATGLVFNSPDQVLLFHIGNTRISGLCDGYIRFFTEDQTKYEQLRKDGVPEDEIPASEKTTLMACLGARRELIDALVISELPVKASRCGKLMITSDGIHDSLSVDEMEQFLQGDITEETLERFADSAVKAGSQDDLSILVIEL